MILLDTDHLSVLRFRGGQRRDRLVSRLAAVESEIIGTTIVNIAEQMRGWLAVINRERAAIRQVSAFRELGRLFEFFNEFSIAEFDENAARRFDELRQHKIRVGTLDLKIASVAIVRNALLLTANHTDFSRIPGLRFENWLDTDSNE